MKLRHVGIPVNDAEKEAEKWETMGIKRIYDNIERVRVIKLDNGMEFLEFIDATHNLTLHVAFTMDKENEIYYEFVGEK